MSDVHPRAGEVHNLTPQEVAKVVRILLTEPAMEWLSGQGLNLYGGSR